MAGIRHGVWDRWVYQPSLYLLYISFIVGEARGHSMEGVGS